MVALLAEGVDRNTIADNMSISDDQSPSSRRAWIEIERHSGRDEVSEVALLAEGVDRNQQCKQAVLTRSVALLAEGVDRNAVGNEQRTPAARRPPRGGRG